MIYLVEDDESIRELVVYTLNNTGFDAKGFDCAEPFWNAVKEKNPRLVILDVMLPKEDGLSILKKLRQTPETAKLPVMMLTAKGAEYDKVAAFEAGADDYMPKPAGMMELVARVKSLLRRTSSENGGGGEGGGEFSFGGAVLSVVRHEVTANGKIVALTLKEFDLLACLMKNAGATLTREQLLSNVWGYSYEGETRTVDAHIVTLRGKLGDCGGIIKTVRGVGYKIG